MIRKAYEFVKETFPYIIIGMLATYIYADHKMDGEVKPISVNIPYLEQDNLDKDTMIRNATTKPSKGQIRGQMKLQGL
ncbi:hypothetical protein ANS017_13180 [Paraclostridium bifermentans]|uniref:hypothetical protein n=1 Tax=Paraclostridium bifermentans TaxID=1490 RepID=UPI0021C3A467|nr:hypothetical protein [Paraclostridium bifermentans]GKZ02638.1 hypothetical protein ANS014_10720 [Paraclostridium bifermentans]GKZ07407.1 hypothetical protein ANS015_22900 [Paraclostridium bifermentans]GKZ09934.1 hypothetical protein ANS017_13180 [Paraclostridium bifermentans]